MHDIQSIPRSGLKGLLRKTAKATVGRLPIIGPISRKLWQRARGWWQLPYRHEAVLGNLHSNSSQVDIRFAQLNTQMQQIHDSLRGILLAQQDQAIRHLGIMFQTMCEEQRGKMSDELLRVADHLAAIEDEIARLHDHHATSYNRLAESTRTLVAEIQGVTSDE